MIKICIIQLSVATTSFRYGKMLKKQNDHFIPESLIAESSITVLDVNSPSVENAHKSGYVGNQE
ncbi:hypothetical protein O9G_000650 [Rozella allomycis CSF55]|uniref:Uncharacterized protein n=1 Tax=Rozella allomycis (strain CSF55) TaxID=988480 RepID=A0A075AYQ6_ROZAC|nr:hypothetical protein O9G_000650 [Rozella allomycis CSF55]|eukprot:EPZ35254.1 hypothetical protein O9G_000650 [Rozella allomycis CSF55]